MTRLNVFFDGSLAGWLTHDPILNLFSFDYTSEWLTSPQRCALSPLLPLTSATNLSAEVHSSVVRQFFENLLPEGKALDDASVANNLSRSNLAGLMIALGGETAGALQISLNDSLESRPATARPLSRQELSDRIRSRPDVPFSVWDGKVRLSIAGYQDKISVFKRNDQWFIVDGKNRASTVILKPEPVNKNLAGLPANELFCMRLAKNIGLDVAKVRLIHVPEPVLEIERFDRIVDSENPENVRRLHIIDGCQALGLPVSLKYERPYGDANEDVRNIRDGATLPKLFRFLRENDATIIERSRLLNWTLFQILIGNTDAHAKNISFFSTNAGYTMAPAYDLLCTLANSISNLDVSFAMSIGDSFSESEMTAFEWAYFSYLCELPPRFVSTEMKKIIGRILSRLSETATEVIGEGAEEHTVTAICDVVKRMCQKHLELAPKILEVDQSEF